MLNRFYGEAIAAFGDDGRSYMKGTQRTWLKFRDQACEWPYRAYPCGTLVGTLSAECMLTQTALRTLDLLEMRSALKERRRCPQPQRSKISEELLP